MIYKIIGAFIFVLAFLPLRLLFGSIKGFKWTTTPYIWLLSITITVLLAWLVNAIFPKPIDFLISKSVPTFKCFLGSIPRLAFLILGIVLYFISANAFSHQPLLIDSIVQLFQAKIFSSGNLVATSPPFLEFFVTQHMIFDNSGWYGQYPPGHSLLLVLGVIINYPWIIPIILSISSSYLIYKFTKNIFDEDTASLTLLLFCISPFFLFMGASYMNHVTSLFICSIMLYSFERWEKTLAIKFIILLSFAAGFQILVRPLDLIAISLVLFFPAIKIYLKQPKHILPTLIGLVPPLLFGLLYNRKTTGDYFLPGYIKLWGSSHGLGFHESPWGHLHTPLTGLRNELVDLQLMQEMLFEGSIPSLYFVAFYLLFEKKLTVWPKRLLVIGFSFPLMYFFYWHRDAFLGPRFLYSSIAIWLPLTAFSIVRLYEIIGDYRIRPFGLFHNFYLKNYLTTLIIISFVFSISINIPARFLIYSSSLDSLKKDIFKVAKKNDIHTGLVFIKTSWGVRIISRLRGVGLSASLVQKAYTFLDHCFLHELIETAKTEGWDADKLKVILLNELTKESETQYYDYNFDLTLRFDPERKLTISCIEELKYDVKDGEKNYTVYEPYMRANDPNLSGPFIFAKDLRSMNIKLTKKYPNYSPLIYDGNSLKKLTD